MRTTLFLAFLLTTGCGDAKPENDSDTADGASNVIDGQMPESDWRNDDGWYLIVRADASACMMAAGLWWGAGFEGPLTVQAGMFSWNGTHIEAHAFENKDDGAPVTATGTVDPALLTMHLEVEGSPEHTSDVAMEPTDFGKDDDCWMVGR